MGDAVFWYIVCDCAFLQTTSIKRMQSRELFVAYEPTCALSVAAEHGGTHFLVHIRDRAFFAKHL